MKPLGGTELLYKNLTKYVGQEWIENIHLLVSAFDNRIYDETKKKILWQHLMTDQYNAQPMSDATLVNRIDQFVYVSNWQMQQFIQHFNVGHCNNMVIKNAIEPITFKEKPKDKIRLVYNSMPDRGLEVLLDAFDMMNTKDIELVVHSSNITYGTGYAKLMGNTHEHLFNRCRKHSNITYKGFAMNPVIRTAVQSAHILAYPSIFAETSCLVAIEAGAAGCKIVTTDYGALTETCDKWATYINHTDNKKELAETYAAKLTEEIDNYTDTSTKEQSDWFNETYSWDKRKEEWKNLLCEK
jgi:glycosyltransferase involved in cell wall biosynthesis